MIKELFKFRKANFKKLEDYGFKKVGDKHQFATQIFDEQFDLFVFVDKSGEVSAKVFDRTSKEEYVLHLMTANTGEFVGKVREEFQRVLEDIKKKCFDKDVFKSKQAKQVVDYIRKVYGDELDFLWKKFPTNAILRRKDNKKWYGILAVLTKRKLGLDNDDVVDIIDLRIEPEMVEKVVDNEKYFAGYHMNKKHWFSICLDGSVAIERIYEWIYKSYALAKKR